MNLKTKFRRSRWWKYSLAVFAVIILWIIGAAAEMPQSNLARSSQYRRMAYEYPKPRLSSDPPAPIFTGPIQNVTASMRKEAVLICPVTALGNYRLAWVRVEDQSILTIEDNIVPQSTRYYINGDDPLNWELHIRPLNADDTGCYMCQINTTPMIKQIGCLEVQIPPIILDGSSSDIMVREGEFVSLICIAEGNPAPRIKWRREDGTALALRNDNGEMVKVDTISGDFLNITSVERHQAGPYLCIASNNIPPSVSKRIELSVSFAPIIVVAEKEMGVTTGSNISLECFVEAFPKTTKYWLRSGVEMIQTEYVEEEMTSEKFEITEERVNSSQEKSILTISDFGDEDVGIYTCVASNPIGKAEKTITLYGKYGQ